MYIHQLQAHIKVASTNNWPTQALLPGVLLEKVKFTHSQRYILELFSEITFPALCPRTSTHCTVALSLNVIIRNKLYLVNRFTKTDRQKDSLLHITSSVIFLINQILWRTPLYLSVSAKVREEVLPAMFYYSSNRKFKRSANGKTLL